MFKKYTKKLFTRFLLIVVLPIVLLQAVLAYVFYVRHWDNVHRRIETALVGEVASVMELLNRDSDFENTKNLAHFMNLGLKKTKEKSSVLKKIKPDKNLKSLVTNLDNATKSQFVAEYSLNGANIVIHAKTLKHGMVAIEFSNKRISNPTTKVFFMWMVGSATFLLLIALLFMKNQVRSIVRLVQVADRLGKGQDIIYFKPTGAEEVRLAGRAFIRMKNRIERQIYFRTQLLAHISHDLRTPLTRIRLNSEFIKDRFIAEEINAEVTKMEELIVDYLNFAKEEGNEKSQNFNLIETVLNIVKLHNDHRITFSSQTETCMMTLKKSAMERVINNLIDNSLKYANETIDINMFVKEDHVYLVLEDDGIGIPKEFHKKVFKPFFKLDEESKGFGLGLAIVKSIILSHGGKIKLGKSTAGGLKVIVKLPI